MAKGRAVENRTGIPLRRLQPSAAGGVLVGSLGTGPPFEVLEVHAVPDQKVGRGLAEVRTLIPEANLINERDIRILRQRVPNSLRRHPMDGTLVKPALWIGGLSRLHNFDAVAEGRHSCRIAYEITQADPHVSRLQGCREEHRRRPPNYERSHIPTSRICAAEDDLEASL